MQKALVDSESTEFHFMTCQVSSSARLASFEAVLTLERACNCKLQLHGSGREQEEEESLIPRDRIRTLYLREIHVGSSFIKEYHVQLTLIRFRL